MAGDYTVFLGNEALKNYLAKYLSGFLFECDKNENCQSIYGYYNNFLRNFIMKSI